MAIVMALICNRNSRKKALRMDVIRSGECLGKSLVNTPQGMAYSLGKQGFGGAIRKLLTLSQWGMMLT